MQKLLRGQCILLKKNFLQTQYLACRAITESMKGLALHNLYFGLYPNTQSYAFGFNKITFDECKHVSKFALSNLA